MLGSLTDVFTQRDSLQTSTLSRKVLEVLAILCEKHFAMSRNARDQQV